MSRYTLFQKSCQQKYRYHFYSNIPFTCYEKDNSEYIFAFTLSSASFSSVTFSTSKIATKYGKSCSCEIKKVFQNTTKLSQCKRSGKTSIVVHLKCSQRQLSHDIGRLPGKIVTLEEQLFFPLVGNIQTFLQRHLTAIKWIISL